MSRDEATGERPSSNIPQRKEVEGVRDAACGHRFCRGDTCRLDAAQDAVDKLGARMDAAEKQYKLELYLEGGGARTFEFWTNEERARFMKRMAETISKNIRSKNRQPGVAIAQRPY